MGARIVFKNRLEFAPPGQMIRTVSSLKSERGIRCLIITRLPVEVWLNTRLPRPLMFPVPSLLKSLMLRVHVLPEPLQLQRMGNLNYPK